MWDSLKIATKDQLKIAMDASKTALEDVLKSR
jgi:hypothetical protein